MDATPSRWWDYFTALLGDTSPSAAAAALGIAKSSVSRWRTGDSHPRAETVIVIARTYQSNPLHALIAAWYISVQEAADMSVNASGIVSTLSDAELLRELLRRVGDDGDLAHPTLVAPLGDPASPPGDDVT